MRFGLKDSLISSIKNTISKYPSIERAVIFGSRAKGDYKYNSDIDIAIFCDERKVIRGELLYDLNELDTLLKFDVVDVNKVSDEHLINNIKNEGVEIYNKQL